MQETKIFSTHLEFSFVARPGVKSHSCVKTGIFKIFALKQGGTLTKPPLLKSKEGFIFKRVKKDTTNPEKILKTSRKFLKLK